MISRLLNPRGTTAIKKASNCLTKSTFTKYGFSTLTEHEFLKKWDSFQQDFVEKLENEELGQFEDFEDNAETVTVESLDGRVLVLSRHSGNKEIW